MALDAQALNGGAQSRTWTDTAGRTIEGEALNKGVSWVQIRRSDGTVFRVSFDKLSESDRAWIAEWNPPAPEAPPPRQAPVFQRGERVSFESKSGRNYEEAKVIEFRHDSVILLTRKGVFTVLKDDLPVELALRLPDAPNEPPPKESAGDVFALNEVVPDESPSPPKPNATTARPKTPDDILKDLINDAPKQFAISEPPKVERGEERTIRGQVFIVTQGRTNVKLGLVAIGVVAAPDVDALNAYIISEYIPWGTRAQPMLKSLGASLALEFFKFRRTFLSTQYARLPVRAAAKTDADGEFVITTDVEPPFYLVAQSSRKVGDDEEHYRWVVRLSEADTSQRVLLSNDNLD